MCLINTIIEIVHGKNDFAEVFKYLARYALLNSNWVVRNWIVMPTNLYNLINIY